MRENNGLAVGWPVRLEVDFGSIRPANLMQFFALFCCGFIHAAPAKETRTQKELAQQRPTEETTTSGKYGGALIHSRTPGADAFDGTVEQPYFLRDLGLLLNLERLLVRKLVVPAAEKVAGTDQDDD